jgi:anti-sigma28 factor (negative regulator of flagellin synthesis)
MQNNPVSSAFINHAISGYNKTASKRPEKSEPAAKRTDVLEINISGDLDEKITYAAKDIAGGIRSADDSAKAQAIAQKIKSGTYGVSASEIAKAILGIN